MHGHPTNAWQSVLRTNTLLDNQPSWALVLLAVHLRRSTVIGLCSPVPGLALVSAKYLHRQEYE